MNKHLLQLIILFGIISAPQLFAQPEPQNTFSTQIKGQVLDSLTKEPIAYATLYVSKKAELAKPIKVFATDDSGKFQIALSEEGEFLLTSHYVGKSSLNTTFQLTEKDKTIDLAKLWVHDNQELSEIVVTAIKPLVQVELDKISYSMEDDPDAKTNNVLEMMKKVPLVTVDAEDNVQLRGSSGYKIYLDGKPSNMISNNPGQALKSMPAEMVKKIEVITDPGAKYDAEGVTGIINIITNKQQMGGYTGTLNTGANLYGCNLGGYLTAKYGKLGVTGNYSNYYHKNKAAKNKYFRENYEDNTLLETESAGFNRHRGQFGSGELSYEFDTLNLVSVTFNLWNGGNRSKMNMTSKMLDASEALVYKYTMQSNNENSYGNSEINANYQRTFTKKDELLTASYRLSVNPSDQEYETKVEAEQDISLMPQRSASEAETKEHTFQLDYTTPLANIHTIEAGAKYIIRMSESDNYINRFDVGEWKPAPSYNDQFRHRQDILSAYGGYNLKYKKVGFKTGLRIENTGLDVQFPKDKTKDFNNRYFNWIPSATLSYQYKMVHNFRLGYNLRIYRPGIWHLNPYINDSDPRNIRCGNPDLEVEKLHNFNLNYGVFKQKFNLNVNATYSFINNSIEEMISLNGDVSKTSYENIGKKRDAGIYLYGSWSPTTKLRLTANTSGSYIKIEANNVSGLKNSGFVGRFFGNIQYTFPHDFIFSVHGGAFSPWLNLQGKSSSNHFYSASLNKSFLKKNLTISLSAMNVFEKYRSYSSESTMEGKFHTKSIFTYPAQNFRIGVSYKFGEMKQQIKQVRRGINNDDAKAGGQGEGGGEGGGMQ